MSIRKKLFRSLLLNQRIRTAEISRSVFTGREPKVKIQDFYICSFSSIILSSSQFESCRKVVTRIIRRQKPKASFLPLVKFTLPRTSKSKNARMGKGKGGIDGFVSRVDVFGSLFLLRGVSIICAAKICKQVQKKLNANICVLSLRSYQVESSVHTSMSLPSINFSLRNDVLIRDID
jgi:ribosomal protein L16/L10AE